ncbi:MAG: DUF3455 domain-containing protein [Ideonella sp.]
MLLRSNTLFVLAPLALITACAGMTSSHMTAFDQSALPDAVKVPTGHMVAMHTIGAGDITYECRAKANVANAHEWVFVGPQADLNSRGGAKLGTYYGPPATWASTDGSKITGTQLATAPGGSGNIPMQLVKANPASSAGAMNGVTYIQRVATRGGVAPAAVCDSSAIGSKQTVKYQADYIFWKAA